MDDETITGFALAAQRGDAAAAASFIRATEAQLRRVLAHMCDRGQEDDLTQETYLRAFGSLSGYGARSPARLWLLSIARRVAADHIRAIRRRPRTTSIEDPESWDRLHHRPSANAAVEIQQIIATLEPERRAAFVLTQIIGLSYTEAAQVCGCAVGTIRSRVFRARTDLIAELGEAQPPSSESSAGFESAN